MVGRLILAGHWCDRDPAILIVTDAGYDITRLAFVLDDLPVELLGRLRSDRVLRLPKPPRRPGAGGRPRKHGPEFALNKPATWPEPAQVTITVTPRDHAAGRRTGAPPGHGSPHRTSEVQAQLQSPC